jgi:hypothetical protein
MDLCLRKSADHSVYGRKMQKETGIIKSQEDCGKIKDNEKEK